MQYIKILIFCLFITSCTSLLDPVQQNQRKYYELSSTLLMNGCSLNTRDILYVANINANVPYDVNKMYYSTDKYSLNSFNHHAWASIPADMITQAIIASLINSCVFKSVVTTNIDAKYTLLLQLITLKQDIVNNVGTTKLSLYAQLMNGNRITNSKMFDMSIDGNIGPQSMAISANELLKTMNKELIDWIIATKKLEPY